MELFPSSRFGLWCRHVPVPATFPGNPDPVRLSLFPQASLLACYSGPGRNGVLSVSQAVASLWHVLTRAL